MSQYINGESRDSHVPITTSFGGLNSYSTESREMLLLALSHTRTEHIIYMAIFAQPGQQDGKAQAFGVRRLMSLTGLRSYSSVRRSVTGLVEKLSIEASDQPRNSLYRVFKPGEIFLRRRNAGKPAYPPELHIFDGSHLFPLIAESVLTRNDISRRQAMVALFCAEGQSNAEIGRKLRIDEKTVKYHLRSIYTKFGLKRRAELVGFLLR
jgi:DNA-binding CsgD family transcriptional regulator